MAEDDTLDPAMRDNVRAWVRPTCKVGDFLEAYSRAGGTHHSALVLGEHTDAIAAFGRMLGVEVRGIGGEAGRVEMWRGGLDMSYRFRPFRLTVPH